ncbi:MAG: hypothetical protein NC821_05325, partial [Candidatus Omnitrophica bacterium]|nr:hypothetical protein [Candidatus Omnitrophota bacterium]
MNIGIIGLPLSGKTLLFTSLVGNSFRKEEHPLEKLTLCSGNLKLEDKRLLHLAQVFGSRKITFPEIKIQDIIFYEREKEKWSVPPLLREVAGFVGVLRCFEYPGLIFPDPLRERRYIEEELILKDLEIVQKRIARIEQEMKKGKKDEEKEFLVLQKINHFLEENRSLREVSLNPGEEKMLHGFKFLSQKPIFFVLNLDERMGLKEVEEIKKQVITEKNNFIFASLKLESELSEMKT